MCHLRQSQNPTPHSMFLRGRTPLRLWSLYQQGKTRKKHNSYRKMMTMTSRRKKAMRRKKKRATRLKVKKKKTTLLGATPRRMRCSTMSMTSKLLEMKPNPH
jgi:hypothetical protein